MVTKIARWRSYKKAANAVLAQDGVDALEFLPAFAEERIDWAVRLWTRQKKHGEFRTVAREIDAKFFDESEQQRPADVVPTKSKTKPKRQRRTQSEWVGELAAFLVKFRGASAPSFQDFAEKLICSIDSVYRQYRDNPKFKQVWDSGIHRGNPQEDPGKSSGSRGEYIKRLKKREDSAE